MNAKRSKDRRREGHTVQVDEATVRLHVEALDGGGYVATSPDVPGLVAEGRGLMEAVEIAQGLTRKIVESCREHGDPLSSGTGPTAQGPGGLARASGYPLRRSDGTPRRLQIP